MRLRTILAAGALGSAAACHTPVDPLGADMTVEVPEAFSVASTDGPPVVDASGSPWWRLAVDDDGLNALMELCLAENRELEQALQRLAAAEAQARAAGAQRFPTLDLQARAQQLEIDQRGGGGAQIPIRLGETYSLGPSLSYELDLFGRIGATRDAAALAAEATAADARATGLALTGSVMEAWLDVAENAALRRVIEAQIVTGEQLLDLAKARFGGGSGTALAVFQQERQLEATRAELPGVDGAHERAENQLAVLTGSAPGAFVAAAPDTLPALPPLPDLDVPSALFERRPDLTAALLRVRSQDRTVAAAVAARYPRLDLSATYNFDANEAADLFDRTIRTLTASLTAPILDGGALRAEVARTRAQLAESLAALQQTFLVSLREVEDALSLEQRGLIRLRSLERQIELSRREVDQARRAFVGGVDSYLPVLAALQQLQVNERAVVVQRVAVLRARAQLLRALGGGLGESGPEPAEPDAEPRP